MSTNKFGGQWLRDLNSDLEGSDRACAVLAGAILDDRLRLLLQAYLRPPKSKKTDRLLGRGGALESFAACIELSRRLNLIDEITRTSLNWVRDIRNDAAHKADFSFVDASVKAKVANILTALNLKVRAPFLLTKPYDTAKGNFVAGVVILVLGLETETKDTKRTSYIPNYDIGSVTFSESRA
jgi:hypothetical protein